jgi:hypothetical protein
MLNAIPQHGLGIDDMTVAAEVRVATVVVSVTNNGYGKS